MVFPFLLLLLIFTTYSCKKEESVPPPIVEVISPEDNQNILLPDEVRLHLEIKSEKRIKFVQVSFVNYDNATLFEPVSWYFDTTHVEIDENVQLGLIPQGFFSPYFMHVTVIGGAGTHTYFHQIKLTNPETKYKGLYVTTRPAINQSKVYFYEPDFSERVFASIEGEYVASTTADFKDYFYLITTQPGKLFAFSHDDAELIWSKTPELPNPEYTTLKYANFTIFSATKNGRIKSYHALTGNTNIVSTQLHDSIPHHVQATSDHILGEFEAKNSNSNLLVLFYRGTGTVARKRPLNYDVADIQIGKYGFNFLIFGNESQNALVGTYNPLGNFITNVKKIEAGLIRQVEKYDADRFFLNIDNSIYLYNYAEGFNKLIREFSEEVVAFKYEPVNSVLFVAFEQRVEVYSYPANQLLHQQNIPYRVKSIDVRIGY
ncbi:MAG: hypothetical protein P8100_03000 [bacterium]